MFVTDWLSLSVCTEESKEDEESEEGKEDEECEGEDKSWEKFDDEDEDKDEDTDGNDKSFQSDIEERNLLVIKVILWWNPNQFK